MMAGNQPLPSIPSVRVRIPRRDSGAGFLEVKSIQPGIECGIATDLNETEIDCPDRLVLEEMFEVLFFLRRGDARLV